MARQKATITTRTAALASEFGLDYATRLFGADVIRQIPTFTRGKNVGKPKGSIRWEKCEVGGWSRDRGGVVRPGLVRAALCEDTCGSKPYTLTYAGRVETMDLSADYLGEDGRKRLRELHGLGKADIETRVAAYRDSLKRWEALIPTLEGSDRSFAEKMAADFSALLASDEAKLADFGEAA